MQAIPGSGPPRILRAMASLWFGAVLLVLLLVAMACATVYESTHGTEQALFEFYTSWWFAVLLALLGINVVAALVIRYPFQKGKIGFVVTHLSLLLIMAGAVVTKLVAVNGQLAIVEGETLHEFRITDESLALVNRTSGASAEVHLDPAVFGGLAVVNSPRGATVALDDVTIRVMRYLPDGVVSREVVNDGPHPHTAVEVSLSASGREDPAWIFAGESVQIGSLAVALTMLSGPEELGRKLSGEAGSDAASVGTVKVEIEGTEFALPIEECMDEAAALGDTGYSIRVLEYFPHATVGPDNTITNASTRPMNPAIRAEIAGPSGAHTRLAFARFPDFGAMHGDHGATEVKITFVFSGEAAAGTPPVEVLTTPDGELQVRFSPSGGEGVTQALTEGEPVETPWPGQRFTVLRRFDRARMRQTIEPADPIRETRAPAVLVRVSNPNSNSDTWVRKHQPRPVTIDGTSYEIVYADRTIPLGFEVKLDKFTVGYYPGGNRPRSFESQITITDAATGRAQNRVISMNNPTSFGGYNFYQSSYQLSGSRAMSVLSVARDPGTPIVFAGYIGVMGGMLWVLGLRMRDRRRLQRLQTAGVTVSGDGRRAVDLPGPGERCSQGPLIAAGGAERDGDGAGREPLPKASTPREVSR